MRKQMITGALVMMMALGSLAVTGCTSATPTEGRNAGTPAGAPAVMPPTHEGRFDTLGASGCYGCHGASERSNPMLNGAVALPEDHYVGGSSEALELDPTHDQCNTCHV